MKTLVVSIIILALTSLGVGANAAVVCQKSDAMLSCIDSIYNINEENIGDNIKKLILLWEDAETLLSICANRKDLGEIEHLLTQLTVAYYENDEYQLIFTCSSLVDIINEIRDTQIFDLKTIL